jgi:hypothetical protein
LIFIKPKQSSPGADFIPDEAFGEKISKESLSEPGEYSGVIQRSSNVFTETSDILMD